MNSPTVISSGAGEATELLVSGSRELDVVKATTPLSPLASLFSAPSQPVESYVCALDSSG